MCKRVRPGELAVTVVLGRQAELKTLHPVHKCREDNFTKAVAVVNDATGDFAQSAKVCTVEHGCLLFYCLPCEGGPGGRFSKTFCLPLAGVQKPKKNESSNATLSVGGASEKSDIVKLIKMVMERNFDPVSTKKLSWGVPAPALAGAIT